MRKGLQRNKNNFKLAGFHPVEVPHSVIAEKMLIGPPRVKVFIEGANLIVWKIDVNIDQNMLGLFEVDIKNWKQIVYH